MVSDGGVRGVVLEESRIGVFQALELRFDGFGEAIVDHGVGWWRGRRRGRRVGGDGGSGRR